MTAPAIILAIIVGVLIAAGTAAAAVAAYRREHRTERPGVRVYDESTPLAELLTVEHEGADEGWSPAEDVTPTGNPLERDYSEIELIEPLLFEEIASAYPVRLDWQPPSFTQGWEAIGERLADMGDTQALPAVAA
jgi:hypothetical protein